MKPERSPRRRLAALDMTKGVLVVLMVVYHSFNYTNQYHLGFRYLSFLPPSFILITGFLLGMVYLPQSQSGDLSFVPRVLWRGLRLLVIFTLLNITAQYVRSPAYGQSVGVTAFFESWYDIYVLGQGRMAAFEVLLPIAYLLLLAPLLLTLTSWWRGFLVVFSTMFVCACVILDFRGESPANLSLMCAGFVGLLCGYFVNNLSQLGRYAWFWVLGYLVYFPFSMVKGYVLLLQLAGALVALGAICALCQKANDDAPLARLLARAGQYSLVSYIVQIGLLQTLSRFLGRPDPLSWQALVLFSATLLLMGLIVEGIHWMRGRLPAADRAYRLTLA